MREILNLVDNRLRVIEKKMWTIAGSLTIISFVVSPIGQRFVRRIDNTTTTEYNNRKVITIRMSDVEFKKHRVFRETQDVIFYDISVEDSNASDLGCA